MLHFEVFRLHTHSPLLAEDFVNKRDYRTATVNGFLVSRGEVSVMLLDGRPCLYVPHSGGAAFLFDNIHLTLLEPMDS